MTKLIEQIIEKYPPRRDIDPPSLADGFMSVFEGAFILSKSFDDPAVTLQQLRHYKTYCSPGEILLTTKPLKSRC